MEAAVLDRKSTNDISKNESKVEAPNAVGLDHTAATNSDLRGNYLDHVGQAALTKSPASKVDITLAPEQISKIENYIESSIGLEGKNSLDQAAQEIAKMVDSMPKEQVALIKQSLTQNIAEQLGFGKANPEVRQIALEKIERMLNEPIDKAIAERETSLAREAERATKIAEQEKAIYKDAVRMSLALSQMDPAQAASQREQVLSGVKDKYGPEIAQKYATSLDKAAGQISELNKDHAKFLETQFQTATGVDSFEKATQVHQKAMQAKYSSLFAASPDLENATKEDPRFDQVKTYLSENAEVANKIRSETESLLKDAGSADYYDKHHGDFAERVEKLTKSLDDPAVQAAIARNPELGKQIQKNIELSLEAAKKSYDDQAPWYKKAWDYVVPEDVTNALKKIGSVVSDACSTIYQNRAAIWEGMKDLGSKGWDLAKDLGKKGLELAKDGIVWGATLGFKVATLQLGDAFQMVKPGLEFAGNVIAGGLELGWNVAKFTAGLAVDVAVGTIKFGFNAIVHPIDTWNKVASAAKVAGSFLYEIGESMGINDICRGNFAKGFKTLLLDVTGIADLGRGIVALSKGNWAEAGMHLALGATGLVATVATVCTLGAAGGSLLARSALKEGMAALGKKVGTELLEKGLKEGAEKAGKEVGKEIIQKVEGKILKGGAEAVTERFVAKEAAKLTEKATFKLVKEPIAETIEKQLGKGIKETLKDLAAEGVSPRAIKALEKQLLNPGGLNEKLMHKMLERSIKETVEVELKAAMKKGMQETLQSGMKELGEKYGKEIGQDAFKAMEKRILKGADDGFEIGFKKGLERGIREGVKEGIERARKYHDVEKKRDYDRSSSGKSESAKPEVEKDTKALQAEAVKHETEDTKLAKGRLLRKPTKRFKGDEEAEAPVAQAMESIDDSIKAMEAQVNRALAGKELPEGKVIKGAKLG